MTIGKKLYAGFGLILAILSLLFVVNIIAGWREKAARDDAGKALESVRTVESVRYQIMLNRLNMNNFLLSGDPRDEEKVNKGLTDIIDQIKRGESQASSEAVRTALIQVESTEASWADNFAKPLIAKRHQVDSGDATVSDLQIFYLQKDPSSWLTKSSIVLDHSNAPITKSVAEGGLTVEVVARSKRDTLGNALLRMSHGLQDLVRTTRDSAGQVSAGSNQVAGAADESAKVSIQASSAIEEVTSTMHEMSINVQNVVKNTQVQASSVAETSASIDQMLTSIQRVADTAQVLLDIANPSREDVVTGIQTMEKTTDGLNRPNQAIQSSAEIINILDHPADDIGKIIEVIDD